MPNTPNISISTMLSDEYMHARKHTHTHTLSHMQDTSVFTFEVIQNWIPANMRSRNRGPESCLDLQIWTNKGNRELRMRTPSPAHVQTIIKDLNDFVRVRYAQKAQFSACLTPSIICLRNNSAD